MARKLDSVFNSDSEIIEMADPFYCKLYIESGEDLNDLQGEINRLVGGIFTEADVEAPLFKNEDFDSQRSSENIYDPVYSSQFYVELGLIDENDSHVTGFQTGAVELIKLLRRNRFVTASCDFEELIAAETGWNWTEETPEPPGRNS